MKSPDLSQRPYMSFIDEMYKKYEIIESTVIDVLGKAGMHGFDPLQIDKYRKIIAEHVGKQHKDTVTQHVEVRPPLEVAHLVSPKDPCPVEGCPGKKIRMTYGWRCTHGGRRHYYAYRTASIAVGPKATIAEVGTKAREIVIGMEKLDVQQAEEHQEGLQP